MKNLIAVSILLIFFFIQDIYSDLVNNNRISDESSKQKETNLLTDNKNYSHTVNAKGDLNVSFPLATLPGKNISYQLTLNYQGGIRWAQAASEIVRRKHEMKAPPSSALSMTSSPPTGVLSLMEL